MSSFEFLLRFSLYIAAFFNIFFGRAVIENFICHECHQYITSISIIYYPQLKQIDLIKYFNKLFNVLIPEIREVIYKWLKDGGKVENIGNLDETALFYKIQRSQTLASSAVEGRKVPKDRLTIALMRDSLGNKKFKPLNIWKHKRPHPLVDGTRSL